MKGAPAMAHDIDALLRYEELSIRPTSGAYDEPAFRAHLQALDGAWNDPVRPQVFLLFRNAAEREAYLPTHVPSTPTEYSYPIVPVVELRPDQIYLNLFAGEDYEGVTRPLLEWLLSRQDCTVE